MNVCAFCKRDGELFELPERRFAEELVGVACGVCLSRLAQAMAEVLIDTLYRRIYNDLRQEVLEDKAADWQERGK